jgi:hypothetical protein
MSQVRRKKEKGKRKKTSEFESTVLECGGRA